MQNKIYSKQLREEFRLPSYSVKLPTEQKMVNISSPLYKVERGVERSEDGVS